MFDVGDDADNLGGRGERLQPQCAANGATLSSEALGGAPADDHARRRAVIVSRGELAPGDQRDAQHAEVPRPSHPNDRVQVCRILSQSGERAAAITGQRQFVRERDDGAAESGDKRRVQLLVEGADGQIVAILRCGQRDSGGQETSHVESRIDRRQALQAAADQQQGGDEHEGGGHLADDERTAYRDVDA